MMKIHTTQNLSLTANNNSTNCIVPNQIRYSKTVVPSDQCKPKEFAMSDSVSFRSKGNSDKGLKALKNAVAEGKKSFGERVANWKFMQRILKSDSCDKVLENTTKQEVMISSVTSLVLCCGARPATIMALPGEKNKQDCQYAAAHSFSSGVFGFIVPFACIKPLASGYDLVLKEAHKYIKEDATLKKMWSHLDLKSVRDAQGNRTAIDTWLDINGNKFIGDIKDARKIALPKHISEISEETLTKYFKDLDVAAAKGKSANEWLKTSGSKAEIELKDVYIAVQKGEGGNVKYYPLATVEESILKEVCPGLDIASTKGADGSRLHFNQWKQEGKSEAYNFDMDQIFISDWDESSIGTPLITGHGWVEKGKDGKEKFVDYCYQKNNNPDDPFSLGTAITKDMKHSDKVKTILDKLGGWLPDIVVAYPRATATIALIPFVLQKVIGLEKSKKPAAPIAPAVEKAGA